MKKILIITYYWPPSGGAAVHRWLAFSKYLKEKGYSPIIYTPENPDPSIDDASLLDEIPDGIEVIKRSIWEPYGFYKRFTGQNKNSKINTGFIKEDKKTGLAEEFSVWVRGNLFIPDARKFWIKPSIAFLKGFVKKEKIDLLISTGPPHSMHLIALGLKKSTGVKWIADFRDPWTNIDFYTQLKLSSSSDKKHKRLEKEVLQNADLTLSVGNTLGKELAELGAKKVSVITNGFDGEFASKGGNKIERFSIGHFGSFSPTRNPHTLWKALAELSDEIDGFKEDLTIELVGKVDNSIVLDIDANNLSAVLNKTEQLSHKEALKMMENCALLLLVANNTPNAKGILTSKMFEYIRASRPILAIGPKVSDMSSVLQEVYDQPAIDYIDLTSMKERLKDDYQSFKTNTLNVEPRKAIKYHRRELTNDLIKEIEQL